MTKYGETPIENYRLCSIGIGIWSEEVLALIEAESDSLPAMKDRQQNFQTLVMLQCIYLRHCLRR